MKVTFLGVGEAFDENNTHTCILVEAAGRRMLVDCNLKGQIILMESSFHIFMQIMFLAYLPL